MSVKMIRAVIQGMSALMDYVAKHHAQQTLTVYRFNMDIVLMVIVNLDIV